MRRTIHGLVGLLTLLLVPAVSAQSVTLHAGRLALLNGGDLTVTGDLTLDGAWSTGVGCDATFAGTSEQRLGGKTTPVFRTVTLHNSGGDLVLDADAEVRDVLFVDMGDLDLNGHTIDLGTTGKLVEAPGARVKGTSGVITATRTLNAPAGTNVAGLGAEITTDVDLGTTTVTRGHTVQSDGVNVGIARYFDVSPSTNAGLDATFTLHYHGEELEDGMPEQDLVAFRSADGGATWTDEGGTVDTEANTVTLSGVDAFSRWTLAPSGAALPVELVAFDAVLDGSDVVMRWMTASETNNAGFEVQHLDSANRRQSDAEHAPWQVLGFVEGHGTTAEAQSYRYRATALAPGTHRFRLKQIDFDGAFEYSPEVEVVIGLPEAYHLSPPYPNPFQRSATFSLMVRRDQDVEVSVFDALGRRVRHLQQGPMPAGQARTFRLDGEGLTSGLYFVRVRGEVFAAAQQVVLVQ